MTAREASDEESGVSNCSQKSKGSESSKQSRGSAGSQSLHLRKSPTRSPSPRNRELPPSIRIVQEEVRSYNPRAPAVQVSKAGRVGPVRSPDPGRRKPERFRGSDTSHPRRVALEAGKTANGADPPRGRSKTSKWNERSKSKGKGKGKGKDGAKGKGKPKSKGKGKTKATSEAGQLRHFNLGPWSAVVACGLPGGLLPRCSPSLHQMRPQRPVTRLKLSPLLRPFAHRRVLSTGDEMPLLIIWRTAPARP